MRFAFRAPTTDDADAVNGWHYEPPYDRYDPVHDEDLLVVVDTETWFVADDVATGDLAGFVVIRPGEGEVEAGLGLRPDLTGRGLGAGFVEAIVALVRERWDPDALVLDVLPWNERAMRSYEAAGFERGDEFDRTFPGGKVVRFVRMRRPLRLPTT